MCSTCATLLERLELSAYLYDKVVQAYNAYMESAILSDSEIENARHKCDEARKWLDTARDELYAHQAEHCC
jgi:hypothetical protein